MATNRHIDRICIGAVIIALLISILFMNGQVLGIQGRLQEMGYESRLFDTSGVHTIDIVIDDWDAFVQTCQSEEYSVCSVVIDGEAYTGVGIRGKGNTSLSTVSSMDSDRYSFKIEFDQYDSSKSYYGLDKLSLNNLIQDNTMMKDYLTYRMMDAFGVAAPLCSYEYITVNGEDWGLYLAVEGVEDSFLQRNYGSGSGELYKPDSMDMGGGRGNGGAFDFEDFMGSVEGEDTADPAAPSMPEGAMQGGQMMPGMGGGTSGQSTMPEGFDPTQMDGMAPGGNMGGGMGSSDVKLQYVDDSASSYSSIFDNAKTDVTDADRQRLIQSLKTLSSGTEIESVVDVESVLRYFVVHNFVVNGDSYTGSMVHNYYLYEEDGRLSMIPWDYNLAFGTFQGSDAATAVNDDIDAPLSVTGSDRPMIDWIYGSETYTRLYHEYFQEFLDTVDIPTIIQEAYGLIAPYVEKDPTKFCTYEEFELGVETLAAFCALRADSVAAQLAGDDAAVDASSISLADMGTMNHNMGGGSGQMPAMPGGAAGTDTDGTQIPSMPNGRGGMQMPGQSAMGQTGEQSDAAGPSDSTDEATGDSRRFPGGMEMPEGMESRLPEQNGGEQSGFPGMDPTGSGGGQSGSQWILLGVTLLVLLSGLVFAWKFKR